MTLSPDELSAYRRLVSSSPLSLASPEHGVEDAKALSLILEIVARLVAEQEERNRQCPPKN